MHAGKVERCLVVAPETLTVQWLGELWRKYHQVFTLLDAQRLADVARDFGPDFNPFDAHRRAVIALEMLIERPQLTDQAVKAGIDLLVVDEAQRLRRPPGHPGEPGWRAVAPIAGLGRHVLLLSATPLEDDAHGFFRLLQLLRPEEFPEDVELRGAARAGHAAAAVHQLHAPRRHRRAAAARRRSESRSTMRRAGGVRSAVEAALRGARGAAWRSRERQKIDRVRRALASGAALGAVLGPDDGALRQQAAAMDAGDPRLALAAVAGAALA